MPSASAVRRCSRFRRAEHKSRGIHGVEQLTELLRASCIEEQRAVAQQLICDVLLATDGGKQSHEFVAATFTGELVASAGDQRCSAVRVRWRQLGIPAHQYASGNLVH